MSPSNVLTVLAALARHAIPTWVDGGWGVDALLGGQTRDHSDLDLVIPLGRLDDALRALAAERFAITADERPTRVALTDPRGLALDFHLVTFDAEGGGTQQLQDGSAFRYRPEGFESTGRIGGRWAACISPDVQLECHLGYDPDATDIADMRALAARFGLELPPSYLPGTLS